MTARDWLREAGIIAVCLAIGLYILNLGYGFEDSFQQLKNFQFVSDLFTGVGPPSPSGRGRGEGASNRFAKSWFGELPVPFPKNYLLGIDLQQKDFEHYGQPSYLHGLWQEHGWWYYYLYACAIKVPLALWLLGLLAFAFRVLRVITGPHGNWPGQAKLTANSQELMASWRDEFVLLLPAIVIFTVVSSKTGFSEHMRYVLPSLPFLFAAISQVSEVFRPAERICR